MSKKADLRFAQNLASAHTVAFIAYCHELPKQLGDENYNTLSQMATNRHAGMFEFIKAKAEELLEAAAPSKPVQGQEKQNGA